MIGSVGSASSPEPPESPPQSPDSDATVPTSRDAAADAIAVGQLTTRRVAPTRASDWSAASSSAVTTRVVDVVASTSVAPEPAPPLGLRRRARQRRFHSGAPSPVAARSARQPPVARADRPRVPPAPPDIPPAPPVAAAASAGRLAAWRRARDWFRRRLSSCAGPSAVGAPTVPSLVPDSSASAARPVRRPSLSQVVGVRRRRCAASVSGVVGGGARRTERHRRGRRRRRRPAALRLRRVGDGDRLQAVARAAVASDGVAARAPAAAARAAERSLHLSRRGALRAGRRRGRAPRGRSAAGPSASCQRFTAVAVSAVKSVVDRAGVVAERREVLLRAGARRRLRSRSRACARRGRCRPSARPARRQRRTAAGPPASTAPACGSHVSVPPRRFSAGRGSP